MKLSIQQILDDSKWRVGISKSPSTQDVAVLLWALGGGLWDLVFDSDIEFDGTRGEDQYVITRDDVTAIEILESMRVDWATEGEASMNLVQQRFPRSRPAASKLGD